MLSIFQAKDTRFRVSPSSIYLTDVEKRDEGIYSVSSGGYQRQDVVELKVLGKNLNCTVYLDQKYIGLCFSYLFLSTSPLLFFLNLHFKNVLKMSQGITTIRGRTLSLDGLKSWSLLPFTFRTSQRSCGIAQTLRSEKAELR